MTHNVYLASNSICKLALSGGVAGVVEWCSGIDTRLEMWAGAASSLHLLIIIISQPVIISFSTDNTDTPIISTFRFIEQLILGILPDLSPLYSSIIIQADLEKSNISVPTTQSTHLLGLKP